MHGYKWLVVRIVVFVATEQKMRVLGKRDRETRAHSEKREDSEGGACVGANVELHARVMVTFAQRGKASSRGVCVCVCGGACLTWIANPIRHRPYGAGSDVNVH